MKNPRRSQCLWAAALMFMAGCTHLGPRTIAVDRFDYSSAIADSWKQQTLLNIVKLRYMDLPVFVDVASIVSGYSLQTGVSVGSTISSDGIQGNFSAGGAQAIYTDRPTITYVPMTGQKFLSGMMTPIDPKRIFFMLQSGYAADFILGLTVESLNGVRNRTVGGGMRDADPDFVRALTLMREIQTAGAVGMRVEEDKVKGQTAVMFFRRDDDVPADIVEKQAEVRRLLRLPPDLQRFVLSYSPARGTEGELTVNSRSLLQIMGAFASYMDVPEEHVADHSAAPGIENKSPDARQSDVRIHTGKEYPASPFAAVKYRGYWFWIENGDWATKRALTAVMFFFTLAETTGNEQLPLITIPAQ